MRLRFATTLALSCAMLSAAYAGEPAANRAPKAGPPSASGLSWSGFYVGGQIGGGWANRNAHFTANDDAADTLISGNLALVGIVGDEPILPHSYSMSGVVGGVEAGYNWQVGPQWLFGVEADFSGSGVRGEGSATSLVQNARVVFPQTISEQQRIDWYGTVRARLGFLPTDSLLLFVTGGFAYGQTAQSGSYAIGGAPGSRAAVSLDGISWRCFTGGVPCFTGSSSSVKAGWTIGAGAEWMFAPHWSVKVEYQYVDLGHHPLTLTALTIPIPGDAPSSFRVKSGRENLHVGRIGVNFHF